MVKILFLTLFFTVFFTMQSGSQDIKEHVIVIIDDEFYTKMIKTDDELYIYGNKDKYLMTDSPLSFFDGFNKIYQNHDFPKYPILPADKFGATGFSDKIPQCIWFIKNKQLYLANILFNNDEIGGIEKRAERSISYNKTTNQ